MLKFESMTAYDAAEFTASTHAHDECEELQYAVKDLLAANSAVAAQDAAAAHNVQVLQHSLQMLNALQRKLQELQISDCYD